jgi:FKBP-type peptidyl-prolyl cis-trans isomerase
VSQILGVGQSIAPAKADMSKVSYVIGYQIGNGFKTKKIAINSSEFNSALESGLNGKQPKYTKEEMQQIMQEFKQEMMAKMAAEKAKSIEKAKVSDNVKKSNSPTPLESK